jgi:hypothetical protein
VAPRALEASLLERGGELLLLDGAVGEQVQHDRSELLKRSFLLRAQVVASDRVPSRLTLDACTSVRTFGG